MGQLWLLLLWSTVNIHMQGIFKTKQDLPTVCVKKHVPGQWGRKASSPAVSGLQCTHRAALSSLFSPWHLTGTWARLAECGKCNTNKPQKRFCWFFFSCHDFQFLAVFYLPPSHSQEKCLCQNLLAASGCAKWEKRVSLQSRGVSDTSESFFEWQQKLDSCGAFSKCRRRVRYFQPSTTSVTEQDTAPCVAKLLLQPQKGKGRQSSADLSGNQVWTLKLAVCISCEIFFPEINPCFLFPPVVHSLPGL